MSRSIIAAAFAAAAGISTHAASAAPIIAQDNYIASWATDTGGIGQTFVWPSNVPLGVARVAAGETAITGTFKLYNGTHTCDDSGGEFFSQAGNALALDTYSAIVLSAPQALVNGSTYTFCVYNATKGRIALHYTSLVSYYPNGVYVSDNMIDPAGGGGDLQFELDGPLPPPAAAAAAPALLPGLLALLASLVLAIGMMAVRRKS